MSVQEKEIIDDVKKGIREREISMECQRATFDTNSADDQLKPLFTFSLILHILILPSHVA